MELEEYGDYKEYEYELIKECKEEGIPIEEFTYEVILEQVKNHSYLTIKPNDVFENGMIVDVQTLNALKTVYENLTKEENKEKFREMIKNPTKLMALTNKMWRWFK